MFMIKEKIDLKSLPFAEMERAGIRKDEFLNYPRGEIERLLQSHRPCHFRVRIYRFKDKVKSFKNIIKCCGLFPINLVGLLLF